MKETMDVLGSKVEEEAETSAGCRLAPKERCDELLAVEEADMGAVKEEEEKVQDLLSQTSHQDSHVIELSTLRRKTIGLFEAKQQQKMLLATRPETIGESEKPKELETTRSFLTSFFALEEKQKKQKMRKWMQLLKKGQQKSL